ncbi:MAG: endolytic transglycosylase MltG, partial [Saprospiraceae bacterium]|nr:endolytic transglycosylase MltG [Saprospiraceae bacterium]
MLDFNKIFTKKNYPKIIALVVLLIGFVAIALYYQDYLKPNVSISEKSTLISIPDSTSFDNLVMMLKNKNILKDYESFITVSNKLGYKRDFVRGGRYKIENGWNNLRFVRHLRSGNQEPVNLVLHNERNIEEVASKISNFVNIDSTVMLNYIKDSTVLAKYHCNLDDVLTNFIPNTYQVFWNTKPDKLFKRLADEADKFWL